MTLLLLSVLQVVVTGVAAHRVGLWLRFDRLAPFSSPTRSVFAVATGLLAISFVLLVLLFAGWFQSGVLLTLFLVLSLLSLWEALRNWPVFFHWLRRGLEERTRLLLGVLIAGYGLWMLVQASLPPVMVDELVYHLEVPSRWIEAGGPVFFPDNVYAYFPQLLDLYFGFGLAVGGETAARLFHLLFAGLLAAAIAGVGAEWFSGRAAVIAASALLTIPSVVAIAPVAYVDLAFCLYGFLALVAVIELVEKRSFATLAVAAVMAGGAWATKYTGLQLALLLVAVTLIGRIRRADSRVFLEGAFLGGVACVFVLPYLVRNWLYTGWPLFPFSFGPFQLESAVNWDPERAQLFLHWLGRFGGEATGLTLVDRLFAPITVFIRARFNDPGAYDGILGPVFLLVPVLLVGKLREPRVRLLALFSVGFLLYWTLTTQQVRFLLPAMPAICLLLGAGLAGRRNLALSGLVAALLIVNLVLGMNWQLRVRPFDYLAGLESREDFLSRNVAGFPVYREASRRLLDQPDGAVLLVNMGNFGYLLDCRFRSDYVFEYYRLRMALESEEPETELRRYLEQLGVTHILMHEALTLSPIALETRERAILAGFLDEETEILYRNPLQSGHVLRMLAENPGSSAASGPAGK
jgi:4-amino-4-deoxy-L-arabinose transferase-like glycosyltransferase